MAAKNGKNGKFVAEFGFRNPTKRTFRFEETSTEQNIGTLYVQQRAFKTLPKKIRVTVEVVS
jgi:hypothetical protein